MKKSILVLALSSALLLSACSANSMGAAGSSGGMTSTASPSGSMDSMMTGTPAMSGATLITPADYKAKADAGEEMVLIDVRTAEEYAESHIPGAILLPNEDIGDTRPAQLPILDTEIVVYCRSGNRSAQAAKKLIAMGYTNVYDLGGFKDWPYETESGAWTEPVKEGTMSSFRSYDLAGVAKDETVFSGYTLTMVNVWGTFCGPCINEMPELGELAAKYADKGVQIVGIVGDVFMGDDGTYDMSAVETARSLVEQTGADYLHLLSSPDLLSAKLSTVAAVPTTFFVDSKGNVVGESYLGARSASDWSDIIDATLEAQK